MSQKAQEKNASKTHQIVKAHTSGPDVVPLPATNSIDASLPCPSSSALPFRCSGEPILLCVCEMAEIVQVESPTLHREAGFKDRTAYSVVDPSH
jgi:hypothetical protein